MARTRTVFRCMECGHSALKWVGQCSSCGEWNTFVEEIEPDRPGTILGRPGAGVPGLTGNVPQAAQARPITTVPGDLGLPVPTRIGELDLVLGGGLVPGSVTLLGGEPGVGKSTLVLQMLAERARAGAQVLYVTGEESAVQVRLRAERLGALEEGICLAATTSLDDIVGLVARVEPELCVIDSIQTLHTTELSSAPGSVGQVRECAYQLVQVAKITGTTIVLVGHVTKEGNLAGPRVLEHIVDTVLSFEGDRHNILRILRANKHRFGSTEELGLLSMCGSGLEAVADPSGLFLNDRRPGVAGSVVTCTLQGHRPLLVEIQTLMSRSSLPNARRYAQGLPGGRLSLLLAVLGSRLGMHTGEFDVYANAAGGIKVNEPGADLAICLSLVSSHSGVAVDESVVACGEVGLGGELRQVGRLERRLSEATRLGFTTALVPASAPEMDLPMRVVRVPTLSAAVDYLGFQ